MDLHFEYYVVEFLHQPYLDVETYVCVPLSWIEVHAYGPTDRRVAVAYPAEPLPIINKLVKDKRSPRKGWKYYSAVLKFGNDEFYVARKYTMKKNKEQYDKLNKKKASGLRAVVRTSKQTKSLKNKSEKRELKELRVVIHRIPSLEQSMRKSMLEISKNELIMMRPTVIKRTKSLSDTNNSKKALGIPNMQQSSLDGIVKKNSETDSPASKTQNGLYLDSTNQSVSSLTYDNERSPQKHHINSSNCKPQKIPSSEENKIIRFDNMLRSNNSGYKLAVYSTNVISQCGDVQNPSQEENPGLQNEQYLPNNSVINNYYNSTHLCGYNNKDQSQTLEIHNKDQEQCCQKPHDANSIGNKKLHLSSTVCDYLQNKSLMADKPHLLQTISICQKDRAHSKFTNMNEERMEEINNSSKPGVENTLSVLHHNHSVLTQSTGLCNSTYNSQKSLEYENNLESCTQEITNRESMEISSTKQYGEGVNTPPRVSNVSNFARQLPQIVWAVNSNCYSSNYGNSILQHILPQKAFQANVAKSMDPVTESRIQQSTNINLNNLKGHVKYDELKQSCQQSTMKNTFNTGNNYTKTSNPRISNPLLLKPCHQEFEKHSNQGKRKTINQKSQKYKYEIQKRFSQTTQDVLYLSKKMKNCKLSALNPSISKNNPIKYTRPVFSYVNQWPSDYGNNALQSQELRSKEAYTREDQRSKPQNTDMKTVSPNSQNKDCTYQSIQSMYSLANTQNHLQHVPYNPSIGFIQPTILRQNKTNSPDSERPIKENICIQETLSATSNSVDFRAFSGVNKTILNNSKSFVVNDPRKVIIKKVIKVKPMQPKEVFPITKNDSLKREQLKNVITTSEDQVCQFAEKINLIQSPPNNSESVFQKLRIQDIISAEINRMRTSNERTNSKSATPSIFNLSKNDNHNSNELSEENTTMSGLPNHTDNKLLLKNNTVTNDKSMISAPKTPVFENSTLRNLLLQAIHYKNNMNESNYEIICDINNPTHTSEETNNIEKNIEQFGNKQDKINDNLKYNNSNDLTKKASTETDSSTISIIDLSNEETSKSDIQDKAVNNSDNDCNKVTKDENFPFILPPEYKPNDSKWTLKYHMPSFELVELLPGSRVYINKKRLKYCVAKLRNYNMLARGLMLEIFNINALKVCSFTGAVKSKRRRPGLDETARSVILQYVEEHGRTNGWGPMEAQAVKYSMRNKVHEVRYKYERMCNYSSNIS